MEFPYWNAQKYSDDRFEIILKQIIFVIQVI